MTGNMAAFRANHAFKGTQRRSDSHEIGLRAAYKEVDIHIRSPQMGTDAFFGQIAQGIGAVACIAFAAAFTHGFENSIMGNAVIVIIPTKHRRFLSFG